MTYLKGLLRRYFLPPEWPWLLNLYLAFGVWLFSFGSLALIHLATR